MISENCYEMLEDPDEYYWTDDMIDYLDNHEMCGWVNEFNLPDGYIFKDENGNVINATKIILEKKSKKSPKTDDIIK